jgi:hypothetical protein
MIHEGAKAARYCDWLTRDPAAKEKLAAHPWGHELAFYEHWGWIGGALNWFRTDWGELKRAKGSTYILVCDNDTAGKAVVKPIAREMAGTDFHYIQFNSVNTISHRSSTAWPISFDLADEWPTGSKFFNEAGRYIGPTFDDCLKPTIWATRLKSIPKSTGGRPKNPEYDLRPQFTANWCYISNIGIFINRSYRNKLLNEADFNHAVQPFSDVLDTARLMYQHLNSHCDALDYVPGDDVVTFNRDGTTYFNCWTAGKVRPMKGDPAPWLEFMRRLIPDEKDRGEALRYVATLMGKPEIETAYAMLLVSRAQGVGKSTLMEKILMPILGRHNVSSPSDAALTESEFNYWRARKTLVLCHEIYSGHNRKAYTRLNSVITEEQFDENEKNVKQYPIRSCAHVIASSNSLMALNIPDTDRRWFIPTVTEQLQDAQYWKEFYTWLYAEDGLSIIYQWALDFTKNDWVKPFERAPDSERKKEIQEESLGTYQIITRQILEAAKDESITIGKPIIFHDRELVQAVHSELKPNEYKPSPQAILHDAEKFGFKVAGLAKIRGVRTRRLSIGCPACEAGKNDKRDRRSEGWRCDECGTVETSKARDFIAM